MSLTKIIYMILWFQMGVIISIYCMFIPNMTINSIFTLTGTIFFIITIRFYFNKIISINLYSTDFEHWHFILIVSKKWIKLRKLYHWIALLKIFLMIHNTHLLLEFFIDIPSIRISFRFLMVIVSVINLH